jgi:hypothetical protein
VGAEAIGAGTLEALEQGEAGVVLPGPVQDRARRHGIHLQALLHPGGDPLYKCVQLGIPTAATRIRTHQASPRRRRL